MDHPRTATRAAKHDDRRTNLKRIPARESLQYSARFSRARLDALRHKGDPLADAVATELHANHGGLTNVRDLLSTVRANAVPAGAPGCERCPLRRFLDASAEVPSWADPDVIARGQRVHAVCGNFDATCDHFPRTPWDVRCLVPNCRDADWGLQSGCAQFMTSAGTIR